MESLVPFTKEERILCGLDIIGFERKLLHSKIRRGQAAIKKKIVTLKVQRKELIRELKEKK
ncbi:hypothetical protein J4430_00440 [Candidatus Woesearchaeota archaeon]|nr:hypothetical protein [Candidatus Woesearchaeota archaeon]